MNRLIMLVCSSIYCGMFFNSCCKIAIAHLYIWLKPTLVDHHNAIFIHRQYLYQIGLLLLMFALIRLEARIKCSQIPFERLDNTPRNSNRFMFMSICRAPRTSFGGQRRIMFMCNNIYICEKHSDGMRIGKWMVEWKNVKFSIIKLIVNCKIVKYYTYAP